MTKWLAGVGVALALLGGAYYWLIVESHAPSELSYRIDLGEVRRLADAMPGEKAGAIRVEKIAAFEFPATGVVAGDGWDPAALPVYSYEIVFPDRTILVDTAMDKATAEAVGTVFFDEAAYARMSAAMAKAALILVTHEHMDHIGGLTAQADAKALLAQARLTKEQIANLDRARPAAFPEGALDGYAPLDYDAYAALAPGVVLIKAPGHSPGSQMVYVRTADGEEFLFLGDVAWHMRNVELVRERARLVTWWFLNEDRDAVFGQLAELHRLRDAESALHIVPGHDAGPVDDLIAEGLLVAGFGAQTVQARPSDARAAWEHELAEANAAYAGNRRAILKVDDAVYLKDGETAALVAPRPGEARYRWVMGGSPDALLSARYADGKGLVLRAEETIDLLAEGAPESIAINPALEVAGALTQMQPGETGLRVMVYNQDQAAAKVFSGLDYFPYDPAYRITARFAPAAKLEPKIFQTSRGWYKQFFLAGEAVFALEGRDIRLPLYAYTDDRARIAELGAFFTDALTGTETYGVGRYLDIAGFGAFPPNYVALDFNYAYNPNCARSEHYNCPYAVDDIPVRLRAGERDPHAAERRAEITP